VALRDVPQAAAAPVLEEPLVGVGDLDALIGSLQHDLFLVHHNWRKPLLEVSDSCLELACGVDEDGAAQAMAAFLLLPGISGNA
jgi:hypothetical protein